MFDSKYCLQLVGQPKGRVGSLLKKNHHSLCFDMRRNVIMTRGGRASCLNHIKNLLDC